MIRIGIVGVGYMGMIHYLAARKLRGGRATAICSRDPKKRAGDWRGIRGNFGPAGDVMDLRRIKKYDHLDAMLQDPEIDLVDICAPTDRHAPLAIAALKAGKNVLVEKPIAREPKEADVMLHAAERSGKLLLVAHVLPFIPEFSYAAAAIRDGRHGPLVAAHFKRVISRPDWSTAVTDLAQSGGPALDLHIHDAHFILLIAGMPQRISSTGVMNKDSVDYLVTQYDYGGAGPCLSCCSGALAQKGRPFVHGYEIYLQRATLVYESGTTPLTELTASGAVRKPKLRGGDDPIPAFTAELQAAVDSSRTGQPSSVLDSKRARDALVLCFRECQSVRTGKTVSLR